MTFKKVAVIVLMTVAYLATFILGAASGAIHPACYAYIGTVLPILTALWFADLGCHFCVLRLNSADGLIIVDCFRLSVAHGCD